MNEREFLENFATEYERVWGEIDGLLRSATPEQWQAIRQDNGSTTAQIVEHLYLSEMAYKQLILDALGSSPASDGTSPVRHGLIARLLLMALARPSAPMPKVVAVTWGVNAKEALAHWETMDRLIREFLSLAQGRTIQQPRFANPLVKFLKMSVADALAILLSHLKYHLPQIQRRLSPSD